jgi:hypothetical protein
MIRLTMDQGSAAWMQARLGIPTSSRFDELLTPKTMKFSASSTKYAWELLAEQITGHPVTDVSSGFLTRGNVQELKAIQWYEMRHDVDTEEIGFIMRDDRRVGCSPDRLVGTDGILEVKVPKITNHIGYLLDDEGISYKCQRQGQLWLTEREWSDGLSYCPGLPNALVRTYRDEAFIKALAAAVDQFNGMLDEMKLKLQTKGLFAGVRIPDLKIA